MLTVNEKLSLIQQARDDIKTSLENKGQTVNTDIRTYADAIDNIKCEDLQEQLDAQDTVIQQLQDELANKTSGSAKPNIFLQLNEPEIKEGIWIQAEGKTFDKIILDNEIVIGEQWDTNTVYANIPYEFYAGVTTSIGSNIYIFGGGSSRTNAYKYDTLTNTFSKLANCPYEVSSTAVAVHGTDIYLIGGNNSTGSSRTKFYKYNTITNTYTDLGSTPDRYTYNAVASVVGDYIYLLIMTSTVYKYDIINNTWSSINKLSSYSTHMSNAVAFGTDIYYFGGETTSAVSSSVYYAYKYDTLTDTYTKLTDVPFAFQYGGAILSGKYIYLLGGNGSSETYRLTYKYDIQNDTYTRIDDIPVNFYNTCTSNGAVLINDKIYIFGGYSETTKIKVLNLKSKEYENNSIVISQAKDIYKTQLFNNNLIEGRMLYSFDDVWHNTTESGLDKTLPTYYGNGTEWVKFKN